MRHRNSLNMILESEENLHTNDNIKSGKQLFSKFCEGYYSLSMRTFNVIRRGMKLIFKQQGNFDIYFQQHVELC